MKYFICDSWRQCPQRDHCTHAIWLHEKSLICSRDCENSLAVQAGLFGTCHEVTPQEEVMLRLLGVGYEI
jgi:hypothetical protein